MQPDDPNPHLGSQPKESQLQPFVEATAAPIERAPVHSLDAGMDSIQLDLSQMTAEDIERSFPELTQEKQLELTTAISSIVYQIQSNFDLARQASVLIAGANSVARLIGLFLKP